MRALLAEALLLCGAASTLALGLALAVPPLLISTVGDRVQVNAFAPDAVVFLFAVAMSIVACAIAGLVPALRVTSSVGRMRGEDLNASVSGTGRVRGMLLAIQVALAMVLLVSARLLTRAVTHALSIDIGIAAVDEVQVVSIRVPPDLFPRASDAHQALHDELTAAWPSALAFSDSPVVGIDLNGLTTVRRPGEEEGHPVERRQVSPNYFEVLGIAMLDGRPFTGEEGGREVVLNESAARRLWPGERAGASSSSARSSWGERSIATLPQSTMSSAWCAPPTSGYERVNRQGGCWQSQRSSVVSPACRQWSLQYLPCGPFGSTMHSQAGCAHFVAAAMTHLREADSTPANARSQALQARPRRPP